MKISIITVSYNSAKTIDNTLRSVANQSYENFEHLIIDGQSSDQTMNIVQGYLHSNLAKWGSNIIKSGCECYS